MLHGSGTKRSRQVSRHLSLVAILGLSSPRWRVSIFRRLSQIRCHPTPLPLSSTLYRVGRSEEHNYVTDLFVRYTRDMSHSELFGYAEADRGRFDFACVLTRDHSRQLVGQTLTRHAEGIDKDLASLLHEPEGELPVYLYSHEARNEGRVQEFLHNARRQLPDRVSLLRLFRYPVFDADNESERELVARAIRDQIREDLLLNVLFGRLHATDIAMLLQGTGIPGLLIAVLDEIARNGFINFPALGRALDTNPTTLRARVSSLVAAGMLEQAAQASLFRATPRGRVLLKICALLLRDPMIDPELAFVLDRLDLGSDPMVPDPAPLDVVIRLGFSADDKRKRLVSEAHTAITQFCVDLSGEGFIIDDPQTNELTWIGR